MIKVRVHIYNTNIHTDSNVFIDIELPCAPRENELLYLSESSRLKLEDMIKTKAKFPKTFYKSWICSHEKDSFNLEDAIKVTSVCYVEGRDFIHIELDEV